MFSQELENLIQATLEDGKLEEYEKEALVKRAQAEGVDLTELEIYIQSILQRRQRELNEKKNAEMSHKIQAAEEKKAEELKNFGYKECPKCHKQVAPLTLVCECGFEFTESKHVSAVAKLNEQISSIQSMAGKKPNEKETMIKDAIQMFPIPNTKEDIVDFLALAAPNARKRGGLTGTKKGRLIILGAISVVVFLLSLIFFEETGPITGGSLVFYIMVIGGLVIGFSDNDTFRYNDRAIIWRAKFDQVLMKGRSLRADAEFRQTLDYYENMINQK